MSNLLDNVYKPDVIACLSDLSSDEVLTPPEIANQMLDLLPHEIWSDPNIKILDPACKSGIFLREAAKRFIEGEKDIIPDLQQRIDHVMHNQLYGIAITEMTSLMSRRTLYCSKYPNGPFSVSRFNNIEGNIRFKRINHTWIGNSCKYCGASKEQYDRSQELETYAYDFIHDIDRKELEKMKFDVIIANPPYAQDTSGAGRQAKPIYNLFIDQAKKLQPKYMTMIIPSRWFSGGMGLDDFRTTMMNDSHISEIVDYTNSKDCFPGVSVSGGVCYFLWDRDKTGECRFTNITNDEKNTLVRPLNEFSTLVRYNKAVSIIHKVANKNEARFDEIISSLMPYGLSTNYRGKSKKEANDLTLHSSNGTTYINRSEINKGFDTVDRYKILVSKTSAEHAGEPGKDGRFRVIPSSIKVLGPSEVCTHSYFVVGNWDNKEAAENALSYMKTKFVRFLMLLCISGFGLSKLVFSFVPLQDFSKKWTDEELYAKYDLNQEEIAFIENMIKPMELDGD